MNKRYIPIVLLVVLLSIDCEEEPMAPVDYSMSWEQVEGLFGCDLPNDIAVDQDGNVYVSTVRGVLLSENGGCSWSKAGLEEHFVGSLGIGPEGDVLAGTDQSGVFVSRDKGKSWSNILSGDYSILSIAVDSQDRVFVGTSQNGLFRSIDGGETWEQIVIGQNPGQVSFYDIGISPNGYLFAAAGIGGIYRSVDNGENWEHVGSGLPSSFFWCIGINADGHVSVGREGGIHRSRNDGETWTAIGFGSGYYYVCALAVNSGGDIFAGMGTGLIFRSTDGGDTWEELAGTGVGGNSIAVDPADHIFSTSPEGIFRSSDNGNSWMIVIGRTSRVGEVSAIFIDSDGSIYVGTGGGGIYRSTDGGHGWRHQNEGLGSIIVNSFVGTSTGTLFAGTQNGVYRRSAQDDAWSPGALAGFPVHYLAVDAEDRIFAGGAGSLYRSTDGGETWIRLDSGLSEVLSIACTPGSAIFAGTSEHGIFISSDSGETWQSINNGLASPHVLSLVSDDAGHVFAGTLGGVFRWSDDNRYWDDFNYGLSKQDITALAFDFTGRIFAGSWTGFVFRSTVMRDGWRESGMEEHGIETLEFDADQGFLYAGTNADGLFKGSLVRIP